MLAFIALSVVLASSFTTAQNPYCDFRQNILANQAFDIASPNYPASYGRGEMCRWIATCPAGYNTRADCYEVMLPTSPSCSGDRILVSKTGDPYLNGATATCGNNPFFVVSVGQTLAVGMISAANTSGGRFKCRISCQAAATPQPTCRCGERKQNRIVGGQDAEVNEFRMMAALVSSETASILCGGVIISSDTIMLAAHCVAGRNASVYAILVGDHDISTGNDTNSAALYRIRAFQSHPQYNPVNYDYDVALARTATEIQFNDQVGPVCLPFKFVNNNFAGSKVTLLGWGSFFAGGPTAKVLQKVQVDVISQSTCRSYEPAVTDRQMCTFTPGKDACQFDSGGPLLYSDPATGLWFSVGIISYGRFCASNSPAFNTRLTAVLSWITDTTQTNFCRK